MKLELKESNSPYWLLGLSNGKTTMGSSSNKPCYYKSGKKWYEFAKSIINQSYIDEVYLLSGIEWDNMKGSWDGREAGAYVRNKGKLILSKDEITPYESKYGLIEEKSELKLPNKTKIYTSVATTLEGDEKMKLELKDEEIIEEAIDPKLIVQGIMLAIDNWDELVKAVTKLKELSQPVYDKAMTILQYLKDKGTDIKSAASEIANIVTTSEGFDIKDDEEVLDEGATKLDKGEGSTFENAGTTWKVLAQNEDDTLIVALDSEGNERSKFVVAWGLQSDGSWNQGHYFQNKEDAMKYYEKRAKKTESLKESKIAIKNINSGKIEFEKELKQAWINELKHDLSNDTLEDRKKQYPFKQWCDNLINTGDFEYVKESKIVEPIGNPQTAGSFVNIDIDLDHMEVSDFIIRLTQAIRSEQNAILEYTALRSANGITNEERTNIDSIIEEEKNHMAAITTMLYKQILSNHTENVDKANDEFVLPKFGVNLFDEKSNLKESIETLLTKVETSAIRMSDEYMIGDGESGRIYHGLNQALDVIKNLIAKSGDQVVIQNVTLSDNSKLNEDNFANIDEFINELKSDTNYDEIAYHIHEYSKTDRKKALELMNLLFELEDNKNPKECIQEIINSIVKTEDTEISKKNDKYMVQVDVEYDNDVVNQIFDNIARAIDDYNKASDIKIADLGLQDGKFFFSTDKEVDETFVENFCKDVFDKATNYEYQIIIK